MVLVFHRIRHYCYKLKNIGLRRFACAVWLRIRRRIYSAIVRAQIIFDLHETNWKSFHKKNVIQVPDFLNKIADNCARKVVVAAADEYLVLRFDLLGSGKQSFDHMPWHEDFRLSVQNPHADYLFDSNIFYADIRLSVGNEKQIAKDIKVPWELSRFQHLPVLARAYCATGDVRYADAAKQQVVDWLDNNPYLFGVNWMCPMEVALRATNWIIACQWLQEPFHADALFYQRMLCSLYDHMRYLENNWEYYDGRTSNHYLSNLVGYLYLCYFFDDQPKFDWCYKELMREFDWQIFDEGTSYEGSTRYHQLVTELFAHAFLLVQNGRKEISLLQWNKLKRMVQFSEWCKPSKDGSALAIGDDDSGSLLQKDIFTFANLTSQISEKKTALYGVKQYKQFGLSIIKTNDWHVTLRHHAYTNHQPSGHFHSDAASVTLAYKEIPILVDPGSYLYTASSLWRNQFRSARMHNTILVDGCEQIALDDRLFALNIPEGTSACSADVNGSSFSIATNHALSSDAYIDRKVIVEPFECTVFDCIKLLTNTSKQKRIVSNFILGEGIVLQRSHDAWLIVHDQKPLIKMVVAHGAISEQYKTWIAPSYGKKILVNGIRLAWCTQKELCVVVRFNVLRN